MAISSFIVHSHSVLLTYSCSVAPDDAETFRGVKFTYEQKNRYQASKVQCCSGIVIGLVFPLAQMQISNCTISDQIK